MSLQAKPAKPGMRRDTTIIIPGHVSKQTNYKPVSSFLYRLYPGNWFCEFSDISITLEEFAPAKIARRTNNKKP
jgi:hypothetical protein